MEADVVGRGDDWGEVVTRYPYRKVGMDYLLKEYIYSVNEGFMSSMKYCHFLFTNSSIVSLKKDPKGSFFLSRFFLPK